MYKARQPALDRLVAVKILPPEVAEDPGFTERFTREARALAKLNHPNIVSVHDSGQVDGLCYFVMEFVDGKNLRQVLKEGTLKPRETLAIVPRICEALQYAHDEGFVHRDIKPENILFDKKGRLKIADFGLAKLLGNTSAEITLTGPGHVIGTPHYMAPEQVEHPLEVDHRADIYSLGVVFYEMLTGELPLGRFDPPSRKVQIDVRLDDVVLKSLEKDVHRRYQQASEVRTDVEAVVSAESRHGSPRRKAEPETEPNGKTGRRELPYWLRRCALLVSVLGTISTVLLTWPYGGRVVPLALLSFLLVLLVAAEGAGRVLWWWFLVTGYIGFTVMALSFAEGVEESGPLSGFLCGAILTGVGAFEFGRHLSRRQAAAKDRAATAQTDFQRYSIMRSILTVLLFGLTGFAVLLWGGRGGGTEDVNAEVVPATAIVFVLTVRSWIGFFSREEGRQPRP